MDGLVSFKAVMCIAEQHHKAVKAPGETLASLVVEGSEGGFN